MKDDERNAIVDEINKFRNSLAGGKVPLNKTNTDETAPKARAMMELVRIIQIFSIVM